MERIVRTQEEETIGGVQTETWEEEADPLLPNLSNIVKRFVKLFKEESAHLNTGPQCQLVEKASTYLMNTVLKSVLADVKHSSITQSSEQLDNEALSKQIKRAGQLFVLIRKLQRRRPVLRT